MNIVELQANGKPLIFTDASVRYDTHEFLYEKMSDITHRAGEKPLFIFRYGEKRIGIPYELKDEPIIVKMITRIAGLLMDHKVAQKKSAVPDKNSPSKIDVQVFKVGFSKLIFTDTCVKDGMNIYYYGKMSSIKYIPGKISDAIWKPRCTFSYEGKKKAFFYRSKDFNEIRSLLDNAVLNKKREPSLSRQIQTNTTCRKLSKLSDDIMLDGIEYSVKYKYSGVNVCPIDGSVLSLPTGQKILFRPEPENANDPQAIALYHGSKKMGYLYRNKLRDMVCDWLRRNEPVRAITSAEHTESPSIDIYFYIDPWKGIGTAEFITCKLTGNKSLEFQDAIGCSDAGDRVAVEFDCEKERFLVWGETGDLGYIPNSKTEALEEAEDNGKRLLGLIDTIDESECAYSIKVNIYLV